MYSDEKTAADPYADPPASNAMDTTPTANANGATNGQSANGGGRGRSRSRSRSRSPRYRSPRRSHSPGGYQRRRSPPPPRRPPHAPSAPPPSQVLGVFGLSIRTVENQLEEEFNRYGQVEKVTIVYDARTGRSRGFGFIRMSNTDEAAACIEKLNGIELDGRRIRVDYSITERAHAPTPGEYMGTRRDDGTTSYRRRDDRDYRRDDYRGGSRRDRDRDYYGRDSYRDRDRDRGDWRDRDRDRDRDYRRDRSPRRYGSGSPKRRRSYSRSPPRASGTKRDEVGDSDRGSRWNRSDDQTQPAVPVQG